MGKLNYDIILFVADTIPRTYISGGGFKNPELTFNRDKAKRYKSWSAARSFQIHFRVTQKVNCIALEVPVLTKKKKKK